MAVRRKCASEMGERATEAAVIVPSQFVVAGASFDGPTAGRFTMEQAFLAPTSTAVPLQDPCQQLNVPAASHEAEFK